MKVKILANSWGQCVWYKDKIGSVVRVLDSDEAIKKGIYSSDTQREQSECYAVAQPDEDWKWGFVNKRDCEIVQEWQQKTIQPSLLRYDPATGEEHPYPSEANQYRAYHGNVAWLYNPFSGTKRDARDVGSDVFGFLIQE